MIIAPQPWQKVFSHWWPGTFPTYGSLIPSSFAIVRHRSSVDTGVGGRFWILYMGWNRVKCMGTFPERFFRTQAVMFLISAGESLRVGITRTTSSSHLPCA